MLRAASAMAYLNGRDHVIPDDILAIAEDVLRHRLVLDYSALAANVTTDIIIQHLLDQIPIP